ncbi:MAG: ATP-binding protein [Candidatus Nanoarchaeia archaeon]|nr:ATP-binding protein [Candidatus Nanoarchaeia archaeon]
MRPWYKRYGFRDNPFDIKFNPNLIGVEDQQKKLMDYVIGGNICFVTGESGTGKTSLLKWLELKIKSHTPVYIDCEGLDENFNFEEYLKQHNTLFRSFFKEYPKNIVLLLDEAQASKETLKGLLKLHWENRYIKSIVISQIPKLDNFSKAFRSRIGERVVEMKPLTRRDAKDLLNSRIKGKNLFTEDGINYIFKRSGGVPRKFLETCERVCIELDRRGLRKEFIDEAEVYAALEEKPLKMPKKPKETKKTGFLFFKKKS